MKLLVCLLNGLLHLVIVLGMSRTRTLSGYRGRYCSGYLIRTTSARSALRCAAECSSNDQCVAFSLSGGWCGLHHDSCISSSVMSTEVGTVYAEVQWECFGSSCYYMPTLKTLRTKAEADAVCEAMGAHVLATETQEENDFVAYLFRPDGYAVSPGTSISEFRCVWLDLQDHDTWIHSGQSITFTNWAPTAHHTLDGDYCTVMFRGGWWREYDCGLKYGFLCEK